MENIKGLIQTKYDQLSSSQKKTAYYILENLQDAAISSAQKIAAASDVSEATVHRLAQKLGFDSFMVLKKELRNDLRKKTRAINNLESISTVKDDSWLNSHFYLEAENILETSKEISAEEIKSAATLILDAKTVWVGGWRMGLSVTSYMSFILNYMLGNSYLIPQGEVAEYLARFSEGDVVFLCSFPRYNKVITEVAEFAKERSLKVIAITDSPVSPICKYADVVFIAKSASKSFVDSYTAAVSVCNAIVNEVSYLGKERVREHIEKVEDHYLSFKELQNKF